LKSAEEIERLLVREYGLVLNAAATAKVLGYKSTTALARARDRGTLQIRMFRIAHRSGWFASASALAAWAALQDEATATR
jgi:hypothetical protein